MLSIERTLRPPPSNAITAGDLTMSNLAARTPQSTPSAPAPMQKQCTAAPTQPAPKVETSSQSLTAASSPPHVAPTASKTTRQVTGIAQPTLYPPPVLLPTSQKRKILSPRPPEAHLNQPLASSLRLTRMPWIFSQTKPAPPLPLPPPPPPGLESPLEFGTPRAPLRPALIGPSGSTTRTGCPQPNGEPSPSPAPREQSASRR